MSEEQRQNENCCEQLRDLLTSAVRQDASDIFLIPGMPAAFKIHGQIHSVDGRKLTPAELTEEITRVEKQMKEAAKMLEFEYAAVLRDRLTELRTQLK